ncbi:hypothetical protein MESS2_1140034 [Mesorhizobium metallidurans STM 2683]|uniref:Uncharacterized protein n=1 Tax=Mesorhizobium metallidurans STM 2683 TaxID=1297569 RepID=M5EH00_9HYPH|nr:hypothetical protein MESS2_1140034 [Mesorhizobium metallidurans STM 2683]
MAGDHHRARRGHRRRRARAWHSRTRPLRSVEGKGCLMNRLVIIERFIVSRKRRAALSLCFDAIPKGKRYALFPGKPFHTFPGIALEERRIPGLA